MRRTGMPLWSARTCRVPCATTVGGCLQSLEDSPRPSAVHALKQASRDSDMSIGARDGGTWYRTKEFAGWVVCRGLMTTEESPMGRSPAKL